jgi:hypothetical protein
MSTAAAAGKRNKDAMVIMKVCFLVFGEHVESVEGCAQRLEKARRLAARN